MNNMNMLEVAEMFNRLENNQNEVENIGNMRTRKTYLRKNSKCVGITPPFLPRHPLNVVLLRTIKERGINIFAIFFA